uniref:Serine aminopeptidase S33 domain-containing protein n=1 Tax=Oryza meridionalis TaxID=40149 RepID=A0A0E0BYN7_9ORYZ
MEGGGGEEMMMTSGATGRIVPVFRSVLSRRALLRLAVALHSLLLWVVLLVGGGGGGRGDAGEGAGAEVAGGRAVRTRRRVAEEEDVRRRRALAEEVAMVEDADGEGARRWETFVVPGARRNALFCRVWAPAAAGEMRGILVIIHGLNEHSGRYLHFAELLTSCGFGDVLLGKIVLENPGVPCFLLGHSTGGAVVLKAVAPIFSLLAPKFQFKGANKRGIPVSRDPTALLAKYSDPLVYTGPIRVRTGHEILRISSYLLHNLKKVTVPFMVLHGTADRVTDPMASQDLYNEASSRHKDLRLYDGFLHDLLFEPERDEIATDIIDWMERMLALQTV